MANEKARKAALARVATRAAELMIDYPEASVDLCLWMADLEEVLIHGDPDAPTPKGLLPH